MKNKKTIKEGATIIHDAAERWMDGGKGSISALTIRTARRLSKDSVFNAAAWMMYNYGPAMFGETEKDFHNSVKDIIKILRP